MDWEEGGPPDCISVSTPTHLHPVHGKAVQWLPVSRMTETRCGGVPT